MLSNALIGKSNLESQVRTKLLELGFGHVWLNQGVVNKHSFLKEVRLRIKDTFYQNLHSELESSRKGVQYLNFNPSLVRNTYF